MDRIIAKGLTFTACHGVFPEEKVNPQTFKVDLVMYKDLEPAGREDDLSRTVSYAQVYEVVKELVEGKSFNLIEALAQNIADKLLRDFPLEAVEVTVYKPEAPVPGRFDYFAVQIYRQKD
ncbi:dihydroneopterin aldolase [Thermosyntropha lipolytica DSM 11003]|uniref:7,8-dihydroneopterin aldolase n=1 Tax=Thermosyntropha lipolytica DSM 11003 TaxID=1123382 RepID=A0A1M5JU44_9FIRM|nr:dihydroneopterin aldolase [Thermosyntropha lipolytica]SHG44087.1 dihydroneopterin aldolase [Thermosyntropha lipolytica DSM 11003]